MQKLPIFQKNTAPDPKERRTVRTTHLMLSLVVTLSLLTFGYLGFSSRYLADDYCFSRLVIESGFWGAQVRSYQTWSDRFSTMFFTSLLDRLGVAGMQILPALLTIGLLLVAFFLFRELRDRFKLQITDLEIYILTGLITFISLYTAPDQFQSLFWRAGSVTYTLPVIGMLLGFVAVFSRRDRAASPWWSLLTAVLFLISGGFSETNLALQVGILLLVGIGVHRRYRPVQLRAPVWDHLGGAMVGSVLALGVMLLSPGNSVRMANMPDPPDFLRLVSLSARYGLGYLSQSVRGYPLPFLVTLVTGFCLAQLNPASLPESSQAKKGLWEIPLALLLLAGVVCVPSAYAQSAYPENRTLLGIRWITVTALTVWSYLLGAIWNNRRDRNPRLTQPRSVTHAALILVLCSFYLILGGLQVLDTIPTAQQRAAAWDTRNREILAQAAAGERDVQVQALDSVGRIKELDEDPDHWVNKCAAVYYGVDRISAR